MAAYWSLLSERRVATNAKINPETVIRNVLMSRYGVRDFEALESTDMLRLSGRWEACKAAFETHFPEKGSSRARERARGRSGR